MTTGTVGVGALDAAQHVQPVDALHAQVGDHDVGRLAARSAPAPRRRCRRPRSRTPPPRARWRRSRPCRRRRRRSARAAYAWALRTSAARRRCAAAGQTHRHRRPLARARSSRSISPPWLRTMLAAIGRPRPVPSPRFLVVKKGSKTAFMCSGGDAAAAGRRPRCGPARSRVARARDQHGAPPRPRRRRR